MMSVSRSIRTLVILLTASVVVLRVIAADEIASTNAGPSTVSGEAKKLPPGSKTREAFPPYPMKLLRQRISGKAVIEFTVTKTGSVTNVTVASATHAAFGEAAAESVKKWAFIPFEVDGQPIDRKLSAPFDFNYEDYRKFLTLNPQFLRQSDAQKQSKKPPKSGQTNDVQSSGLK